MLYSDITRLYIMMESTTKSLEKTDILADFIKNVKKDEISDIIMLCMGRVFPPYSEKEIGIAGNLMIKILSLTANLSEEKIIEVWKKKGDLGLTAKEVVGNRKQTTLFSKKLTTNLVIDNLRKCTDVEGKGAVEKKISLIKELLVFSTPDDAVYITRTVLGQMRVGVGEGIMRDAIAKGFNVEKKLVQNAYDLLTDYGEVCSIAKEGGNTALLNVKLQVNRPINVMLFEKEEDISSGFERVGRPCAAEFKYDGMRCQIHKINDSVRIFTRNLEDITKAFPDVALYVKKNINAKSCIIEGETVSYNPDTKVYTAFQELSKRIKRKYDIKETKENIPVVIFLFDLLYLNGKSVIDFNFIERRKMLENILKEEKWKIELAVQIITDKDSEMEKFYKLALSNHEEGIMMKKLDSPYKPGKRVGYGIKIKPIMEPLDLTIVEAELGEGKRSKWFSSFTLACFDDKSRKFLECGKMGTGIKEKAEEGLSFRELTEMLKENIIEEKEKKIKVIPKIVIEVAYEEIQVSPKYSSGFALRFPRLIRQKTDRKPEDCDNLDRIRKLFKQQRGKR